MGAAARAPAASSDRDPGLEALAATLSRRFPGFAAPESWRTVAARYPALAPESYVDLIREPSPSDPVFRQVAPDTDELLAGGRADPMDEASFSPVAGLIHRYRDRVLVMPTSRCLVRCRHCMRKRLWNNRGGEGRDLIGLAEGWRRYLCLHPEVNEVILSGGDPLSISDRALDEVLAIIRTAPRVERVRVHTRAVVAAPARFGRGLVNIFIRHGVGRLVTQFNHAAEIGDGAKDAVDELASVGIKVDNQSVMLGGVNDRAEVLAELFAGLVRIGVTPYYLHHPDPAEGAMGFTVRLERGWEIYKRARELAPFGAAPSYVADRAGRAGKAPVESLIG